jgi:Domain of unknown function (DUF1906)
MLCGPGFSQSPAPSTLINGVLSDSDLGLRYTPPSNMFDETDSARESVRTRAAVLHSTAVFEVILSMGFGDDTSPEWYSVGIETFPRSRLSTLEDFAAKARMNVLAAGARASQIGTPQQASFSGQAFVVSEFEQKEPPLTKRARVYTTIRGSKFVTIAFAANSIESLQQVVDTMRTLEFAGQAASYLGFDRNDYPGDNSLGELHNTFAYAGYWLNNPPGAKANTWAGKRSKVEAAGFGFLVLFNGRLYKELDASASQLGGADASAAVAAAKREGFPAQTIIFLDQEEGGRLLPEQKAYLLAWVDGVNQAGFRAGVYCSGAAAPEKSSESVITAQDIRQSAGARSITYWVTNDACPPSPGCVAHGRPPLPKDSGVDFAEIWQFAQSPKRKEVAVSCNGYHADRNCYAPGGAQQGVHVDLNTATSLDPSHGRTR